MSCVCCGGGTFACVIPACLTYLDMGATSEANGSKLWARFRNQSTGVIEQEEVTVASGRVKVPVWLLPESFLHAGTYFDAWVVRQDDSTASPIALTPEGTTYSSTCFVLQFQDVYMDGDKWNYSGLTIKLEV